MSASPLHLHHMELELDLELKGGRLERTGVDLVLVTMILWRVQRRDNPR